MLETRQKLSADARHLKEACRQGPAAPRSSRAQGWEGTTCSVSDDLKPTLLRQAHYGAAN